MRLGRRLSSGIAEDPPAPSVAPAPPVTTATAPVEADRIASPDERAAEIVAAAARRELASDR